jgi:hypothetical protein
MYAMLLIALILVIIVPAVKPQAAFVFTKNIKQKIAASRFAPSNPIAAIKLPFAADKDKKRYTHIKQNPMSVIPRNLDVVE